MRKLLLGCSLILLMVLCSCSDFNQKGKILFNNIDSLYNLSLTKCQITQKVWSTAIMDGKYALSTSKNFDDYYVPDFNVAINRMEQEKVIIDLNIKIDSLKKTVEDNIREISDKKNESYDKLLSLYTNVIELSNNAKNPTGSLTSFTNDINQKQTQINMLIIEIKARNKDF